ncbi:MAG: hypothetical protein AAF696_37590 [Bacteroidota bacterium]
MHKFFLIFFFCLVSHSSIFGQEVTDTVEVPFIAYWAKGDSLDFKVTKIKNQWKAGILTKADTSSKICRFMVLDSTERSYRISWRVVENLKGTRNIPAPLQNLMSHEEVGDVLYLTDENGQFQAIENLEEVLASMKMVFRAVTEDLQKKMDEKEQKAYQKMMEPIMKAYTSEEGLSQKVLAEIQYIHYPFGAAFTFGDTLVFEEQLPNLLGGDPIIGQGRIYLQEVMEEDAYCILVKDLKLDSKSVLKVIGETLKKMGLQGEEYEEIMEDASYEIVDKLSMEYYYYPGIPIKVEIRRDSDIAIGGDKGRSLELTTIEWMRE